jgi:hypothetical protein
MGGPLEARMVVRFAFVAVLFGAVAGCTLPGTPSPDEIARAHQAIIDGQSSGSEDDSAILIPLFQNGQFFGACSGVLIAENLVLTARHCVSDTDEGAVCFSDGTPEFGGAVYGDRAAADIGVITGSQIKFELDASGMQVFTTGADTLCNNDIALVLLDKKITSVPIAQVRVDGPPLDGEKFRAVGWGVSNNSNGYGRRERDDIAIMNVGPLTDPSGIGGISPNEFEVGESICQGDSGGPAFADSTKAVLGVVSRGGNGRMITQSDPPYAGCVDSSPYIAYNLYTRVDTFPDLFAQAFAAAGSEVWHEGGPDPRLGKTGDSCTVGSACQSDLCVSPDDKGYCTQMCTDTPGSCPDGLTCQTDGDLHICKTPHKGCAAAPGARGGEQTWLVLGVLLMLALVLRRRVV